MKLNHTVTLKYKTTHVNRYQSKKTRILQTFKDIKNTLNTAYFENCLTYFSTLTDLLAGATSESEVKGKRGQQSE